MFFFPEVREAEMEANVNPSPNLVHLHSKMSDTSNNEWFISCAAYYKLDRVAPLEA